MSMVLPDIGKVNFAKYATRQTASANLYCNLFQNNATITHSTVIGDLTPATFSGYAQVLMSGPVTSGTLDGSGRSVTQWDLITWTKSGVTGNTIYGYYVTDNAGALLWVEKFATGTWDMNTDGNVLQMYPLLTDKSQFSNT